MSDKEKLITAYHEGGHALVAAALPRHRPGAQGHDPAARPGPRLHDGAAARRTSTPPRATELLDQLAYMMGGRAAEETGLPRPDHGRLATTSRRPPTLARAMVTQYGMTERLGAIKFGATTPSRSWAATWATRATTPRRSPAIVDEEVKKLIETAAPRGVGRPRREPRRARRPGARAAGEGDARPRGGRRGLRADRASVGRAAGLDRLDGRTPSSRPAGAGPPPPSVQRLGQRHGTPSTAVQTVAPGPPTRPCSGPVIHRARAVPSPRTGWSR